MRPRSAAHWASAPVPVYDEEHPYIHHFPDGNAGVARALVKYLIPEIAAGDSAEALVSAQFDYQQLDRNDRSTRIRLNSTAVEVRHRGAAGTSDEVIVRYMTGGSHLEVSASHVVMACYNMMIPHIVTDLPTPQAEALSQQMKSPLVYTTSGFDTGGHLKSRALDSPCAPATCIRRCSWIFR